MSAMLGCMQLTSKVPLFWPITKPADAKDKTKKPAPKGGPVLIHDAISPVQGTTLLHLLWATWDDPDE